MRKQLIVIGMWDWCWQNSPPNAQRGTIGRSSNVTQQLPTSQTAEDCLAALEEVFGDGTISPGSQPARCPPLPHETFIWATIWRTKSTERTPYRRGADEYAKRQFGYSFGNSSRFKRYIYIYIYREREKERERVRTWTALWDFKFSRRRVWCSELSSGIYCRVMMMEAVRTSETSVDNNFTRHYIPEDNSEHGQRCQHRVQYRKVHVVAFMERYSTRLGKMF
jgi:hypothetical protein